MKKIKNNIIRHRYLISPILILFGVFILPHIPYINLLFIYINILVLFPAVVLLLGFNGSNLLKAGIVLLALSLFTTLIGKNIFSESFGNIAYFTLLLGILFLIRDLLKKE